MTTTTPPAPAKPAAAEVNVFAFRKTARKRAWICPGAGFDFMGRPVNAVVCYLTSVLAFACGIATAWNPSPTTFWTTIALVVLGTILWGFELFSTLTAWPQPESYKPRFNPWYGMLGIWIAITAFGIATATSFQLAAFEGSHMSPAIEDKESILVHLGVDDERLRRGTLLLFDLDSVNGLNESGKLTVGRIIAVPGDKIEVNSVGLYVINGEVTKFNQAQVGTATVAVTVPSAALKRPLVVPAESYFVTQDAPEEGYDSRVLGYAKLARVKSTKMFRFGKGQFLNTIE